jgi:A/G-specific adenine glycosylase
MMLQQTQTNRVVDKYSKFIETFPNLESLAKASSRNILSMWSGLGYNRRALYLKTTASQLIKNYNGKVPADPVVLETFPGIGKATASAVSTFSYNVPNVFIETNIRRVFIHFFFKKDKVSDKEIFPLIEKTLHKENPRQWYYALMDYGAMLAKTIENPNRRSSHYSRQSPFKNSTRKIRGDIIKILLKNGESTIEDMIQNINSDKKLIIDVIEKLNRESFLSVEGNVITIKK